MGIPLAAIIGYAAADAVNPCALAVLTLILIAILTNNPKNRKQVIYAGLSFIIAIYITYFFYGLVIIQLFKTAVDIIAGIRSYLYVILGAAAIILGALNIKDAIWYKPGGLMTEMPMRLRPKVKRLISTAASAKGALVIGIFVTIFLLPCTIGPYVITGGMLSSIELLQTIPWLLLYNLIFVSPMLAITLIVYGGMTGVENVSGWKDRNIRYLHFVAGVLILILGFLIILGFL